MYRLSVLQSIDDVSAADWNALAGDDLPHLRHEFLAAMEQDFEVRDSNRGEMVKGTVISVGKEYLFIDLGADSEVDRKAMEAASACRDYLDRSIAARKASPTDTDDVLNRCLDLQRAGTLGFDDLAISNNIIGLIIGAIPTISRASVQALDQLLDRPEQLAVAAQASRTDDDDLLGRIVFEALRFNPVNPVIYRRAVADTVIAAGSLRARRIPKDSLVLASNLSAMFDPWALKRPDEFRTDRPWDHYMLWGHGLHTCFGAHINRAVVPRLLKPLLAAGDLTRSAGDAGRIDTADTPFPAHLQVDLSLR